MIISCAYALSFSEDSRVYDDDVEREVLKKVDALIDHCTSLPYPL